ncbi:PH domain-containing protein [bacterium SCSIO 12696]|nr:PH domain-containing protein [bacterium SCSIO 12696]
MEIFKSKIDAWLLVVLVGTILVCLAAAYITALQGQLISYALALSVVIGGAGLPVWLLLSTKYVVSNDELKVFSGPFSWIIPITSISSVNDTRSSISSPALSLDRLEIKYGHGKVIMVSPNDKVRFRAVIGY